jgi:hypothetical protein
MKPEGYLPYCMSVISLIGPFCSMSGGRIASLGGHQ